MTSKKWLKLINENEEKIIQAGEKAYADAMKKKSSDLLWNWKKTEA